MAADGDGIRAVAPAKVNLYLHVVGKRSDGYHLLDSLVAFTALGDELVVAPAARVSLTIEGPYASALVGDEDNLVSRAAAVLAAETGCDAGAAITLVKNLPVAAGIGGGSSDAAATLRALARLWGVAPDAAAMVRLGLSLGADVPVCLFGAAAQMSGIGEIVSPAPALAPCAIVLVNPNQTLSTARVFAARRGGYSAPDPLRAPVETARDLAHALARRRNDLAPAAAALLPAIDTVLATLEASPGCLLSRLSGSGPTCFGLFEDEDAAHRAAEEIARKRPEWWVRSTRFRGERENAR